MGVRLGVLAALLLVFACGPVARPPVGPVEPPTEPPGEPPTEPPTPPGEPSTEPPPPPPAPPEEPPPPPPPSSVHLSLGEPIDQTPADDHVLVHDEMVIGYSPYLNAANWVAWRTTPADFGSVPRYSGNFLVDTTLPPAFYRPTHADYTNSGFDRGHMVRSEERTATAEKNRATFVLSNILPQTGDLNRGPWYELERHVEVLVRSPGAPMDAYMIAGAVWPSSCATHRARQVGDQCPDIGRSTVPAQRLAVPEATFKVVVLVPAGRPVTSGQRQTIAVLMPNTRGILAAHWQAYVTTVEELERRTGYDLLSALDP